MRSAVLAAGAKALGSILERIGSGRMTHPPRCCCGERMQSHGLRVKQLLTILGSVCFRRSMFVCPACAATRYPGDELLDVVGTTRSPGLRRMLARAGSESTFQRSAEDLKLYADIEVNAKDVERVAEQAGAHVQLWLEQQQRDVLEHNASNTSDSTDEPIPIFYVSCDGTGVPVVAAERIGRRGKQPDGSARTREVKLGCVFTQTTTNDDGFAVRDPASTSFIGAIQTADVFGWTLYAEALRRGLSRAQRLVILADGAEWIWNLAELHFPGAIQIIDLYHAREHLAELSRLLFVDDERSRKLHRMRWWSWLDEGRVEDIISDATPKLPADPNQLDGAKKEIAYLLNHKHRMRYHNYRAAGLFVGSGVIEAGCGTLVGQRLKRSGMEWSVRGANAIIALRTVTASGRFEDFWESRSA